jgi:predicted RNA binding protein YcfA (HicA-like mRNA interferase family)
MRSNPVDDWTIADVERVCAALGVSFRRSTSGSHTQVKHPSSRIILTIPPRRPIKPVYIRKLLRYIDSDGATT